MITTLQRSLFVLGLVFVLGINNAQAFEFGIPTEAGNVIVETNQNINDTFIGAGQDVAIRGNVERDVIVAGATVGLNGTVGDNVFAAGQTIRIDGTISGGVIAAGADVFIDQNTTITGDLLVAGDTIHIDGNVQGNIRAYGREIVINGIIGQNAILNSESITLTSSAVVLGNITGSIDHPIVLEEGARVDGKTELDNKTTTKQSKDFKSTGMGLATGVMMTFLIGLICSAIFNALAPKYVDRLRTLARTHTGKATLTGLVSTLLVFPLFLLLLVLLVTIPVAFAVALIISLAVLLGHTISFLYVGDLISMALAKKHWSAIGAIAAGALVLAIIGYVPLVGMLAVVVATALGAGTVLLDLWDRLVKHTTK